MTDPQIDTRIDIAYRLHRATLDQDNFPRMGSELCVSAALAREAAAKIEKLRKQVRRLQKR